MVVAPLAPNGSTGATPYEQEVKLEKLFGELQAGFKKMEGIADPNKQANILKDLTNKMQEAKSLIKEFEQEARTDNMPAAELTSRKKGLVQQLNEYIAKKKELGNDIAGRKELIGAAKRGDGPKDYNMEGRKKIKESDESLIRSEKLVAETIEIGTKTAAKLDDQTKQLERVVDDLDQIHFSMKKAQKIIRDITRGIATDKAIMGFIMLLLMGVVVIIVLKIAHIPKSTS
ncbi:MAG: putative plant SNARE 11-like, partial [Trebouxia sp. A1-2]